MHISWNLTIHAGSRRIDKLRVHVRIIPDHVELSECYSGVDDAHFYTPRVYRRLHLWLSLLLSCVWMMCFYDCSVAQTRGIRIAFTYGRLPPACFCVYWQKRSGLLWVDLLHCAASTFCFAQESAFRFTFRLIVWLRVVCSVRTGLRDLLKLCEKLHGPHYVAAAHKVQLCRFRRCECWLAFRPLVLNDPMTCVILQPTSQEAEVRADEVSLYQVRLVHVQEVGYDSQK